MIHNRVKAAALACLAALIFAAPSAAQDKTYLEEYKAYNAALETGDNAAAATHGYDAWQAAERELGDDSLTAILAYNYGQLVLFSDATSARLALSRAMELHSGGIGDLPATELDLYVAFAEFQDDPKTGRKRKALRSALEDIESSGVEPTADIATIWLHLALADLNNGKEDSALEGALKAEAVYKMVAPLQYRQQAEALILQGASYLLKRDGSGDDVLAANKKLVRAARLFPKQKSLESFDPVLSTAMAWNSAAYAMLATMDRFRSSDPVTYVGSRIPLSRPSEIENVDPSKFIGFDLSQVIEDNPGIEDCKIEWEQRKPPKYPSQAARKRHVGAALIGYTLADDLKVHDAFILAEVPNAAFGKFALEALAEWKLSAPSFDHPWCRENRVTVFKFVMNP